MSVTREQLYAEVWAEPMTVVAARYEVSSTFLARVCEDLKVPRPPRGYWAQLKFNKASPRPALPEAQVGDELEWVRGREKPSRLQLPPRVSEQPETPSARGTERSQLRTHPLISESQAHFTTGRVSRSGFLRPHKLLVADVFVSEPALGRALKLANNLYLSLERRGHRVVIAPKSDGLVRKEPDQQLESYVSGERWSPARPSVAYFGTLAVGLTLLEQRERVDDEAERKRRLEKLVQARTSEEAHSWVWHSIMTTWDLPSGRLALRAYSPYRVASWELLWKEEKAGDLLARVDEVCETLDSKAPDVAALVEEGQRREEQRQREAAAHYARWLQEEREKRQAQAVKESRDQLLQLINGWVVARNIETFFSNLADAAKNISSDDAATVRATSERARRDVWRHRCPPALQGLAFPRGTMNPHRLYGTSIPGRRLTGKGTVSSSP